MDLDGRTPPLPEPGPDLVTTIYLPDDAGAPSAARQFVAQNAERLGADLIRDAQLLVTEIVTNALRHGRPDITLRVRSRPPGIGIAVTDMGTGQPVVSERLPTPTQISGRGMLIVDALASAWGVTPNEPPPGKTVWFDLDPA